MSLIDPDWSVGLLARAMQSRHSSQGTLEEFELAADLARQAGTFEAIPAV